MAIQIKKKIKSIVVAAILIDLFKSIKKFDAYKLGIIDKKFNKISKPVTKEEKEAYTLYDRFIFKLRKHFKSLAGLIIFYPLLLLGESMLDTDENQEILKELEDLI